MSRNTDPALSPLSLYIHLPFCVRKCRYCDFYSVPIGDNDATLIRDYIDAMSEEWKLYRNDIVSPESIINTIYIGGGTPSLLTNDLWEYLDKKLLSDIDKTNIREFSVECNPDSFTIEKARRYAAGGVTRLTFGAQSMEDRELSVCGRAHTAARAFEALDDARLGEMFRSIGVDIIYGLPGQTVDTLDDTLTRLLSIPHVKHLSAYELTVGENTPFGRHCKILKLPDDDVVAQMYGLIGERTRERGMYQYEVSNYALPGNESVHNKVYWSHAPYIGLGASAHSYVHPKRWCGVSDINMYISSYMGGGVSSAIDYCETLTPADLAREMLFLGLRHAGGICADDISARTGIHIDHDMLQKFVDNGLLRKSSPQDRAPRYVPTARGMSFADMMALKLID